ncbi:MAG: hypothetical protein HXX12_05820 [Geothrix sp.]|uniref:hypothetical protein n=1 Tax=Geothrix sp. TaxID=1962974 RepID=UPI001841E3F5|nr:hypothetical protein [Geothrix sp.]NWJ40470.1 hypothetical protein [Geothrix sp.]WIL21523.1 MAG: hypothetical protein QOZ81_000787 [Geothrix sp.]
MGTQIHVIQSEAEAGMDETTALSMGVKKLDLGSAIVTFLDDKIFFAQKGSQEHISLHFGPVTKQVDVHRTRRVKGGHEEHETLFAISHSKLGPLTESIVGEMSLLLRSLFRPLRIGWMARNHIGAEPGLFFDRTAIVDLTKIENGRLKLDEAKIFERLGKLEYLEGLFDLPDGHGFSLFSYQKHLPTSIGFGFKIVTPGGKHKLIWCSNKRFAREMQDFFKRITPKIEAAREESALGPNR